MENESLKTAIAVAVALIGTAIYLRRRYGPIGIIWAAMLEKRFAFRWTSVLKAAFVATAVLWLVVWLFTSTEQRDELKRIFYETSPWAPVMKTVAPDKTK